MMEQQIDVRETSPSADTLARLLPSLSRIVMLPPAIIFAVLTSRYLIHPAGATAGVTLHTPDAFTDTRVIGAWILTLLIMQLIFLSSKSRLWLGHVQTAGFMGMTLAIRIYGFTHDGTALAMGNQRIITIVEIVFLILNAAGLAAHAAKARREITI